VLERSPVGDLTFLVTDYGRAFSAKGLGNKIRTWCDEAGLTECSAHGLRKASATIAAERGATESQLMAIFGWSDPKQAAIYTRAARRKTMAAASMHLLSREQNANESFPPKSENRQGGRKRGKKS
jgi:integrase